MIKVPLKIISLFRNFNREIFTRRPEFCLLYEKLQITCQGWKREALTEKYPDLCHTIREVNESVNICPKVQNSTLLNPILFRLDGSILKLRDELFKYARDNLAVVNIYIKDATVTKIRRDQKVQYNSKSIIPLRRDLFHATYVLGPVYLVDSTNSFCV